MRKILFLFTFLLSGLTFWAQQTKILTAEKHNEYGLVYSLPNTSFKIEIVAVKEIFLAGPYSKYAKIFSGNDIVISENKEIWSIEKVLVTPYGVADTENQYLMQLKAGATTYIAVDENGMLLAINSEPQKTIPESLSFIEIEGTPYSGKEYLDFVNEDFIVAQSSFKQSQLLAEEIMEIRDAKLSLTRGTAETMPTDGRQLEIMLESLDKQEKALYNAFTGSSWKERKSFTYSFTPEKEGKFILFRLNPMDGPVSASGKGEPVYISVSDISEATLPVDAKGEEKKLPKDAVIYNIPGNAKISVGTDATNLYSNTFPISQFGMQFGLNPSIFSDKKEPSFAIFDPNTGALLDLGIVK